MAFVAVSALSAKPERPRGSRMLIKVSRRLRLSPRASSILIMLALVVMQLGVSALDVATQANVSLRPLLILPIIVSAVFLRRREVLLFSLFSSALYTYAINSNAESAAGFYCHVINYVISAIVYSVTGEFCCQLFRLIELLHLEVVELRAALRSRNAGLMQQFSTSAGRTEGQSQA